MISSLIAMSVAAVLLLLFLLVAARDLSMLVRHPARGMGTGISRVWAVARTTLLEAWTSRAWMLIPLQILASVVLLLAVRPFDESERIPLYIRVLFTIQEILILLLFWVMASVSLPRDRFFKTIVTNASKPLSRLEIILGKMTGFSVAAFLLLMVMGATSWVMLLVADHQVRSNAAAEYALAADDFKQKEKDLKQAVPPPENKKLLAEQGSLFALNYITVPKDGMSIVGNVQTTPTGLIRYLKGGSSEIAIYRFSPQLQGDPGADVGGPGERPFFYFHFPVEPWGRNIPPRVVIHVTAVRAKQRLRPQEKTLVLNVQDGGTALWEPENVDELFSFPGERDNGEIEVTVSCATDGVFLRILDGAPKGAATDPQDFNILAAPSRSSPRFNIPLPNPRVRGFERRDRQQVSGPTKKEMEKWGGNVPLEVAIYRFPGKDLAKIPVDNGNFNLSLLMDVDKESNPEIDTIAGVEVYNENSPTDRYDLEVPVIEKRTTIAPIPEKYLGGPDPAKRGDLVVMLRCQTMGHWLSLLDNSVRIEKPPSSFVFNLFKSELILFFEAALLIIICVAWSVRLGWPVAMLTAATFFCLGSMRGFIADIQDLGGMAALGFPPMGEHGAGYNFLDKLLAGTWDILGFIIALTPDFRRYDPLVFITQLRNMPLANLFLDLGWTVLYALPFIGLGYLMIRKQELG